jgi:hypothetical protein
MSVTALALAIGAYLAFPKRIESTLDDFRPATMSNVKQYQCMNFKDPMINQIGSVKVGRYKAFDEKYLLEDHELQFPSWSADRLPPKKLMM